MNCLRLIKKYFFFQEKYELITLFNYDCGTLSCCDELSLDPCSSMAELSSSRTNDNEERPLYQAVDMNVNISNSYFLELIQKGTRNYSCSSYAVKGNKESPQ